MKKYSFIKKILIASVLFCFSLTDLNAQLVNNAEMKVSPGTLMAVYSDFKNNSSGEFINDGQLHIFNHWTNDGKIDFTASEQGITYFTGYEEQIIDGEIASKIVYTNFKNISFKNVAALKPFLLAADINIWGTANFQNGIIDADSYNGKVIFQSNATHSNAGNKSFIDGKVRKIGDAAFEYPIGDANYYRPLLHGISNKNLDAYTSHYFFENSDSVYPHFSKQDNIKLIDDREYWEISKDSGQSKIVLTLTLNPETTPDSIYNDIPGTSIQIVRWDTIIGQWVIEGGDTDIDKTMVTAQVSDYGIFTLARVADNSNIEKDQELVVYNALSPNDDGKNDFFHIKGIEKYPENSVEIYNRWGVMVFQTSGYNESDRVFKGYSDALSTVNRGAGLPTGTYYYILKYNNGKTSKQKAGYLYINHNN